ncbi:unnamed protein product [Thlaspi arvense]|uniref:Uncharacterized protein n=1 Tax=Thlaspi arvense TaxID=13288 RepID=A0AAU9T613_THLAR|nr:unnamed protein product [Thlaspi arvense]
MTSTYHESSQRMWDLVTGESPFSKADASLLESFDYLVEISGTVPQTPSNEKGLSVVHSH